MSRPAAVPTRQIDNDRAIVTEWRFSPGAETGWHRHEFDYVVCPMVDGILLLETAQGDKHAELRKGQTYTREAGVEHNVVNDSDQEMVFIEIEMR
ncbi:MAG: cupin domain-containing protein [Pseudomonadota bacterium]